MGIETESRRGELYFPCCGVCEYAIFCPTWGEYKCTKFAKWVKDPQDLNPDCWEKFVTPVISKKCKCEDCFERGYSDEMED